MPKQEGRLDLLIIGAGPAGLSAADCAAREGLRYLVVEKGLIADTIYHYPVGLTVFSTTNELELREGTLRPCREKPTREELLTHYVRFALEQNLRINTGEEVLSVEREDESDAQGKRNGERNDEHDDDEHNDERNGSDAFIVRTSRAEYAASRLLFAVGSMAHPRRLNVPGEDLPKVHHRFVEPYPFVRKDALVVGGGNSAAEAALFLSEGGARATLAIWKSDWENRDPKRGAIKHWVREPLERQIAQGRLAIQHFTEIEEINERAVRLKQEDSSSVTIPNDAVFVLIGADADLTLLRQLGVEITQAGLCEVPTYDPETFETNIPGIYVAGHFTQARHIKAAIEVPRRVVPLIAQSLRAATLS
jgi:thioredoxin reductase (NADPH)